jgi:hypothetical protein
LCRGRFEAHGEETQTRGAHKLASGNGGRHCEVVGRWLQQTELDVSSICRSCVVYLSVVCLCFSSLTPPHTAVYVRSVRLHTPTALRPAQARSHFCCFHANTDTQHTSRVWTFGVTSSHSSPETALYIASIVYHSSISLSSLLPVIY